MRCGTAERGAEVFDLQKASFLKRASAFLFDGILIGVLAVGFGFLLSLLLNYDGSYARLSGLYDKYEQKYRISFDIADGKRNICGNSKTLFGRDRPSLGESHYA